MKSTFAKEYSELPHSLDFRPVDLAQKLEEIKRLLPSEKINEKIFIILDEQSDRFALIFLWLIDNGAIPVPVSHQLNQEMRENLKSAFPQASFIINGQLESWSVSKSQVKDFKGYICLTSGTTGLAKSCYLSISGALANAEAHAEAFGIQNDHQIIQGLPIYHSYGIIAYIWTPLIKKTGVDFVKTFVGLRSLKNTINVNKKVIHISPSQMRFILKDIESPKYAPAILTIGAGAISAAEIKKLLQTFPTTMIHSSYGATELGPRVTSGKLSDSIKQGGFIGAALKGVKLMVQTDAGPLEKGIGMLMVKTDSLKKNTHFEELHGEYYVTRDLVELFENGDVYFLSRGNDIIKKSGISIYPNDIEELIRSIPEISDCLVLKKTHPLYDEVPVLYLESSEEVEALTTKVQEKLPSQLWPDKIVVKNIFPRTALGKIDRQKLLEDLVKV